MPHVNTQDDDDDDEDDEGPFLGKPAKGLGKAANGAAAAEAGAPGEEGAPKNGKGADAPVNGKGKGKGKRTAEDVIEKHKACPTPPGADARHLPFSMRYVAPVILHILDLLNGSMVPIRGKSDMMQPWQLHKHVHAANLSQPPLLRGDQRLMSPKGSGLSGDSDVKWVVGGTCKLLPPCVSRQQVCGFGLTYSSCPHMQCLIPSACACLASCLSDAYTTLTWRCTERGGEIVQVREGRCDGEL
jgi:hypothetical protein